MRKLALLFVMMAALSALACAIEFDISASKTAFVYPLDNEGSVTVSIQKELLDNVEDIRYSVVIDGPASFEDDTKETTGEITKLESSFTKDIKLEILDTPELRGEQVYVTFKGTYVTNSILFGGKKTFNTSADFTVISRGEVATPDDKPEPEVIVREKVVEVESPELDKIKSDLAELKNQLAQSEQQVEKKNRQLFWLYFIIVLVLVGCGAGAWAYFRFFRKQRKRKIHDDF